MRAVSIANAGVYTLCVIPLKSVEGIATPKGAAVPEGGVMSATPKGAATPEGGIMFDTLKGAAVPEGGVMSATSEEIKGSGKS